MTVDRNPERLLPKYVGETDTISFDFTDSLVSGDPAISSPSVTVTVYSGVDASPSAILQGAATISGNYAVQLVTLGTRYVEYLVDCRVNCGDRVLHSVAILPVLPASQA